MGMTDPIADMLTRIRNASRARHQRVAVPWSRVKENIVKVFVEEGTPEVEGQIPEQIEGIKIEVERTDPINIQAESAEGNTP